MSDERTPKPSRREFIATPRSAIVGAMAAQKTAAAVQTRKRPLNVLFFMSDDMRPESACYNSRIHAHSPTSTSSPPRAFGSTATSASSLSAIRRAHP